MKKPGFPQKPGFCRACAWVLAALLVFGTASCGGSGLRGWQFSASALAEIALPEGAERRPEINAVDLDGDGAPDYVCLSAGALAIQAEPCEHSDTAPRWRSPEGWQVVQFGLADLDRSGAPEVSLLVWRPFAPWPIDTVVPNPGRIETHQNADGMSCHVVLIGWRQGAFREVWAGSALADPLLALVTADLDGDGRAELAALESDYAAPLRGPAEALTIWGWNGFGFDLLARAGGRFSVLSVYDAPGGAVYLVTD